MTTLVQLVTGTLLEDGQNLQITFDLAKSVCSSVVKSVEQSSQKPEVWTDYKNPKPELSDVNVKEKHCFVYGETSLFFNVGASTDFAHGSDMAFPIMGIIERILQPNETIDVINEIKFLKPVTHNLVIYAIDSSKKESHSNYPNKRDASVIGAITTSNGRKIEFIAVENTKSEIRELRSPNLFARDILNASIYSSSDKQGFNINLNQNVIFLDNLEKFRSAYISTFLEVLSTILNGINRQQIKDTLGLKDDLNFRLISKVENLPVDISFSSLIRNGELISCLLKENPRRMRSGMNVIVFEFKFSNQLKPILVYLSYASLERVEK